MRTGQVSLFQKIDDLKTMILTLMQQSNGKNR